MAHMEMPSSGSNHGHIAAAEDVQVERSTTPEPPPLAFHAVNGVSRVADPRPIELLSDESCDGHSNSNTRKPIILMSGMGPQEKIEFGEVVERLGGAVIDRQQFDPACTHVVVAKPFRNEKFLAAVATGKWVLHKSYLMACRSEGKFVVEEDHEWGNPTMSHLMTSLDRNTYTLVLSAYKWRQKLQQMKKSDPSCLGAFQGWRVLLLTEPKKEDNFRRLLSAGGATVLNIRTPLTSPLQLDATHIFVEMHKANLTETDLQVLVEVPALVLKPEFIAAHLSDDPAPNPASYTPAEIDRLRARFQEVQSGKKRKGQPVDDLSDSSSKRPRR